MARSDVGKTIYRADYAPPSYLVDEVFLTFKLDPGETRVHAETVYRRNPDATDESGRLVLNGGDLKTLSVRCDGEDLPSAQVDMQDELLVLTGLPAQFTLTVETIINPEANSSLDGLYRSSGNYCTQCEAEGFRKITWFQDRPDVMTTFKVRIEADIKSCPVLLSNGNLTSSGALENGWHYAEYHDPHPKPCYLFALVAGDLGVLHDTFETMSGRKVDLYIYSEHDSMSECDYAMGALKRSMTWDEERFGLEYDLDIFNIVAVGDFNMGAMENKSLNVFNTKYVLASPETASDADFMGVEAVIGHEYFHNWTGNRITCRDWFQLTLKEGLTVFRDQEFTADLHSRPVKRIADVKRLRAGQFVEDSGPLSHPIRPDSYVEINNFYTSTVYEKGAEVIRMIHTLIGEQAFMKGMDLYVERHDNQAVTCEDFVVAMEDASGRDLGQFRHWYSQSGTPELHVTWEHDAATSAMELVLSQSCANTPGQRDKAPFHMPVAIGVVGPEGQACAVTSEEQTSRVIELTEASQKIRLENIQAGSVPSILRGFSAPVTVDAAHTEEELLHLAAFDEDPFARWQALQTCAMRQMLSAISHVQRGVDFEFSDRLIEAFGRCASDPEIDHSFRSQLCSLPTGGDLAREMAIIDPDAIATVQDALSERLNKAHQGQWLALFHDNEDKDFSLEPASMAKRSIRNLALARLCAGGDPVGLALAADLAARARTMTERQMALMLMVRYDHAERQAVIDGFYEDFRSRDLVIDKWFSFQAMASRDDALDKLEGLLGHPDFRMSNPNRVRSVIGAFSYGNDKGFHRKDGAGYRKIGQLIAELDSLNPQVAARMVQSFNRWRRYDPERQTHMRAELIKLRQRNDTSRHVGEIVSKLLDSH